MRLRAVAVIFSGLLCLPGGGVRAQSTDLRPLVDRLDRLERDMNLLQRQIYHGPGQNAVAPSPADIPGAANYEVRISQIEDEIRTITGQIEELHYSLDQMKRRLDALSADVDQRVAATVPPPPPPGALRRGEAAQVVAGRSAGSDLNQPASREGTLGQIPSPAVVAAPGAPPTSVPLQTGALPEGSAQEQYNYAFGKLREADYPAAEQALRSFIQRYPNDPLAANAQYWLGETYYVRKDYNNAAAVFAEGYQKYPKGGKAADNLLKLGMALGQLGQKTDACRAFARLDHDFPTAPAALKDRAGDEKKHIGC